MKHVFKKEKKRKNHTQRQCILGRHERHFGWRSQHAERRSAVLHAGAQSVPPLGRTLGCGVFKDFVPVHCAVDSHSFSLSLSWLQFTVLDSGVSGAHIHRVQQGESARNEPSTFCFVKSGPVLRRVQQSFGRRRLRSCGDGKESSLQCIGFVFSARAEHRQIHQLCLPHPLSMFRSHRTV